MSILIDGGLAQEIQKQAKLVRTEISNINNPRFLDILNSNTTISLGDENQAPNSFEHTPLFACVPTLNKWKLDNLKLQQTLILNFSNVVDKEVTTSNMR